MNINEFEFESIELREFDEEIKNRSKQLIEETIKNFSPIQIGENVKTFCGDTETILQVSEIKLYDIHSWNADFRKLSFSYKGKLLKKNGELMKNRKDQWFGLFEKDGKMYNMPSYSRDRIHVATIKIT